VAYFPERPLVPDHDLLERPDTDELDLDRTLPKPRHRFELRADDEISRAEDGVLGREIVTRSPVEARRRGAEALSSVDTDNDLGLDGVELVARHDDRTEPKRESPVVGGGKSDARRSANAVNPAMAPSAPTTPASRRSNDRSPRIVAAGPTMAAGSRTPTSPDPRRS
jgi:hypothetical protein